MPEPTSPAGDLEQLVHQALRDHPYGTLAVAATAGFVLGGGLASRLSASALNLGGRMALTLLLRRLGAEAHNNSASERSSS